MKNIYYKFVRLIAKLAVYLFYMPIEIKGRQNIPQSSSNIIFAPNHQSAYLDAILVAVFSSKPIYFLTRADVFTFPFKYLLASLNMMPVYRIRDGYKSLSKNEAVFNTCRDLVQSGKPILLFPEASQLLVHYLRPLTSGLSRIAYLAQDGFDKDVYIVPVGLNYFDHFSSGVKLTVNFGKAINVRTLFDTVSDKKEIINEIRERTFAGLKDCMLIPEENDNYERNLKYLNRNNYAYSFDELKQRIESNADPRLPREIPGILFIRSLFDLVNLPYFLLEFLIIRIFVADKTFYASIKHSLMMFAFPVYLITSFILFKNELGLEIALGLLAIQFLSYLIRTRLQCYLHGAYKN